MTQHMEVMDFTEEEDTDTVVGYLELLPPFAHGLGWRTKEFKDGESRIGRNDSQDISIRDPSVSGCHAVIDIVELPDARGKRVALKDLRSTNGTYVLDPSTGGKTRLAPRKTTMLAPEGCQVQFGNVLCKVTMGTVPSASGRTDQGRLEGESAMYDADTQYPENLDEDTEEEEQPQQGQQQQQQQQHEEERRRQEEEHEREKEKEEGGEKEDAREKAVHDESSDRPAPAAEAAQLLADAGTKRPSDAPQGGEGKSQEVGGQSDRAGETDEPLAGLAGDSAATEDPAGVDDSATDEPETQFIDPGMDESTDEEGGAGFAPQGTSTEITADSSSMGPSASLLDVSGASSTAKPPEKSGPPAEARGGDETADEAEVSTLFEIYDETAVAQLAGDVADAKEGALEASQDAGARTRVVSATPMSPSTDTESKGRNLLGSPGGFSDVPTQRQSPARDLGGARAGVHEEEVPKPLPLTDNSAKQSSEMENRLNRCATGGERARDEGDGGDEADDDRSSASSEALIPGPERTAKQDEDDDDCTVSSDALIPAAQDLTGFEDQFARPPSAVRAGEATPVDGSRDQEKEVDSEGCDNHAVGGRTEGDDARGVGGVAAAAPGVLTAATAVATAGESATETDATEIDTDDGGGFAEVHPPPSPSRTHGEAAAVVESPTTVQQAIACDKDVDEGKVGDGETNGEAMQRSPGDASLRRASTEDVMQAIAREQQRAEASGVDVASSQANDQNSARTPGHGDQENDEDTQAPVDTLVDDADEVHEEPTVAKSCTRGAKGQGVAPEDAEPSHSDPFVDRPVDKDAPEAPQTDSSGAGDEGVSGSPEVVKEVSGTEACSGVRNREAEGQAHVVDREGDPEAPQASTGGNGDGGLSRSPAAVKEVSGPEACSGVRDEEAEGQAHVGDREGDPEAPQASTGSDGDEGVSGSPEAVKEVSGPETCSGVPNGEAEGQAHVIDREGIPEAPQASTGGDGDEGLSGSPEAVKEVSGTEACSGVGNGEAEGQAHVGDREGISEAPQASTGSDGDEGVSGSPEAVKEVSGTETCSGVGNGEAEGQAHVVDREGIPEAPQASTGSDGDEGVYGSPDAVKEASGTEACSGVGNGEAEGQAHVVDREGIPEAPQASTGSDGDGGISGSPEAVKEVSGTETCSGVGNGEAEGQAHVVDREVKEQGEPPQELKEVKGNDAREDGKETLGIKLDRDENASSVVTRQEDSGVSKRDEKAKGEGERVEQEAEAIGKEGASVIPKTPSRDGTPAVAFVPRTSGRKRTKPKMFDEIQDPPRASPLKDTGKNKGKGKPKRQSPETPAKVVAEGAEGRGGKQESKRHGDAEETTKSAAVSDADAAGNKQAGPNVTGEAATSVWSDVSPEAAGNKQAGSNVTGEAATSVRSDVSPEAAGKKQAGSNVTGEAATSVRSDVSPEAAGKKQARPNVTGEAATSVRSDVSPEAAGKKQARPNVTGEAAPTVRSEVSPDATEGSTVAENSAGPRDGGGVADSVVENAPTAAAQEKETKTPPIGGPGKRRRNSEISSSPATASGTRSGIHAKRSRKEVASAKKATAGGDEKHVRGKTAPRAGGRDHARKALEQQRQLEEQAPAPAADSPGLKRGRGGGSVKRRKANGGEEKQAPPEGASEGGGVGAAAIGDEGRGKRRRVQGEKVSDSQGGGSSGRRSSYGRGQVQASGMKATKGTKAAGDSASSSTQKGNKGSKSNAVSTPPARGKGAARGKSGVASGTTSGSSTPPRASSRIKGDTAKQGSSSSPKTPAKPTGSKGHGPSKANDVRVCFTNIMPTRKERGCLKKLGITEVENVLNATHLVAGGKDVPLKRTPKLLAGIGRCDFVVDVDWLYESAKVGRVLEGLEYVLFDAEAEKKWGFKMRSTLARRSGKGLLDGISVHVDPALAGLKGLRCPPLHEMKMVVESAGARWLPTLPKGGFADPTSVLVISHPDALAVPGAKGAKSRAAVSAGRGQRGYVPEMLFLSIMKQKLQWSESLAVRGDAERLEPGRPAGASSGGRERNQATPRTNPAKRRRS